MPIVQSQSPYFDDYDETKNFHQILFRPGFGVQARELSQLQTILQDQVGRLGEHFFKNGSPLTGGSIFSDLATSIKLDTGSNNVSLSLFSNTVAKSSDGLSFFVKQVVPATGGDPDTIIGSFKTSIYSANSTVARYSFFANNETLSFYTANGTTLIGTANTASIANVNFDATLIHQSNGIFYVDGYAVRVDDGTVIASKYNSNSSFVYGLTRSTSLISSDDDSSLLDNATGASNFTAPGAHRLKLTLTPTVISLSDKEFLANTVTSSNFFEQLRVIDGALYKERPNPDYNKLEDVLAQRTFEESGNYAVENFILNTKMTSANTANLFYEISPGTAYIRGYRNEFFSPTQVVGEKARDTDTVENYNVSSYYGNYIKVHNLANGHFDIDTAQKIELHNVENAAQTQSTASNTVPTKIGTANIRQLDYDSGTSNNAVFKMFLFNIEMEGANTFLDVKTVVAGNTAANNISASANVVSGTVGEYSNGSTRLYEPNYNQMLFTIPYGEIATVTEHTYVFRRLFEDITFTSGVATISTASSKERFEGASGGDVPASLIRDYYQVIAKTTAGGFTTGEFIPLDTDSRSVNIPAVGGGSVGQATIDLQDAAFNGTADVYATIEVTAANEKTKTLVSNATVSFSNGTVAGQTYTLGKSDGYRIKAIYESPNTSVIANSTHTDVTTNYTFFNGQKDNFYDHATIFHKLSVANTTGQINVVFDYFTHSGLGAFVVDSYNISYPDINGFTSERSGEKFKLRNVIDFRPRRTDGSPNTDITFDNSQIPQAFDSVDTTANFYLKRTDKLFLTTEGKFKLVKGIPSFDNPVSPDDVREAMKVATISLNPYTFGANDINVITTDNRRYTMRDIGKIEDRLNRVEYYTSLSLLEKEIEQLQVLDENGNELFKNGILVDSFSGFGVADVLNPEFKASIDMIDQYARPMFASNAVNYTTGTLTGLQKTGDLITFPYTEDVLVRNDLSSNTENVNPFRVYQFTGDLKLSPDSDIWYEANVLPVIGINQNGQFDNYEVIGDGSEWNDWKSNWSGYDRTDFDVFAGGGKVIQRVTNNSKQSTTRSGIVAVKSPQNIYSLIDQKVLNRSVIPYMRSIDVIYTVHGLTPNTVIHAHADGVSIDPYVQPNGVPYANTGQRDIVTDENGYANGVIHFPRPSNNFSILTGTKTISFGDSLFAPYLSTTIATATFAAEGYFETVQGEVISAKKKKVENRTKIKGSSGTTRDTIDVSPKYTKVTITDTYGDTGRISLEQVSTPVSDDPDTPDGWSYADAANYYNTVVNPGASYTAADAEAFATALQDASDAIGGNTNGLRAEGKTLAGSSTGILNAELIEYAKVVDAGGNALERFIANETAADKKAETIKTFGTKKDPIAETFFVNQDFYPDGTFVSSVDLYFATKDLEGIPVQVQIRPTVNGVPSSEEILPLSTVYKNPDDITVSSDGSEATTFTFDSPVYLEPGKEYALVVLANSDGYNVHVSRLGETDISSGNLISRQPFTGVFFRSSNASTYSPDQFVDLKFNLKRCVFSKGTGTAVFNNVAYDAEQQYHTVHLNSHEMRFNTSHDIDYQLRSRISSSSSLQTLSAPQNKNYYYDTTQKINASSTDELRITATMANQSNTVSPVIDASRASAYVIKNLVNNSTDVTTPETTATGGDAQAKYVSRRVTLSQDFDATRLKTYLKVNRSPETSIEVYYKALSSDDTTNFDDRPYVQMTRVDNGGDINTAGRFEFIEDEFEANTVSYTSDAGSFTNIRSFAVKVVFYTSNDAVVPKIKDLRVVALS